MRAPANPIMCIECGYLHGHHAVSCERRRMTGEQLYQRMQARLGVPCELPTARAAQMDEQTHSRVLRAGARAGNARAIPRI